MVKKSGFLKVGLPLQKEDDVCYDHRKVEMQPSHKISAPLHKSLVFCAETRAVRARSIADHYCRDFRKLGKDFRLVPRTASKAEALESSRLVGHFISFIKTNVRRYDDTNGH